MSDAEPIAGAWFGGAISVMQTSASSLHYIREDGDGFKQCWAYLIPVGWDIGDPGERDRRALEALQLDERLIDEPQKMHFLRDAVAWALNPARRTAALLVFRPNTVKVAQFAHELIPPRDLT